MSLHSRAADLRQHISLGLAMIALAIAGCSSGDSTSPPPVSEDQWSAIAERAWTLLGKAETYKCVGVHVTSDEYFTGFRLASPSQTQNETMLTISDTPVTEGPWDCGAGSLGSHLIYAARLGTMPMEFPAGFGVHVAAGQYLLLNIHLVNSADTNAADSTRIESRIGTAADVTTPIDMMLGGTFQINIPPDGVVHTATGSCYAAVDKHVLALLPLMRARGIHQTVQIFTDTTSRTLFDQDLDLQHNSYTQFAPPVQVHMGDKVLTRCSYVNTGSHTEQYGESSQNESCFSAMYRYPISASGNLYDCAQDVGDFDLKRE
jgi:hypothetical protein